MDVGGVSIYETGPLATARGGVDIERIRAYIGSRLHLIPRYRQRVAYTPLENQPIWVDDDRFNLTYHVRHTSLPRPGSEEQLRQLTARIMSQKLDRQRPLWEYWIVEGLQGGRFAMLTKAHHCMIDGVSGVDLAALLMRAQPEEEIEEAPPWRPRPVPSAAGILREAVWHRMEKQAEVWRGVSDMVRAPRRAVRDLGRQLGAIRDLLAVGLKGATPTPLNGPIGPFRRFDWYVSSLADIKTIRSAFGGTVNDVVLSTVAGAVRRFLLCRHVDVESLTFRVTVPVNVREASDHRPGNRVSAWLVPLPVAEKDPRRRFAEMRRLTEELKTSHQEVAADVLTRLMDWTGSGLLLSAGVWLASALRPYNLLVTNVRGPSFPLYLLGARMLEAYPQVPLFENQGLGIALLSYEGKMFWGFNADWDIVPDLRSFVEDIGHSFRELYEASTHVAVELHPSGGARARRRSAAAASARHG